MRTSNIFLGAILVYVVVLMTGCEIYNPNNDKARYPELTGKTHYTCFGDGTYKSHEWYELSRKYGPEFPRTGDRKVWAEWLAKNK